MASQPSGRTSPASPVPRPSWTPATYSARPRRGRRLASPPAGSTRPAGSWPRRPGPAPARRGGGAPGTPGSTTRAAAWGSPARSSRRVCLSPAGSRCGSSPGPSWPPRTPRCSGPRRRRPSSFGRASGPSPVAKPGSPMPGSPRTARGTGTVSPAATSLSFVVPKPLRRIARWPPRITATPYSGNSVTQVPVTPYTTSADVNHIRTITYGATLTSGLRLITRWRASHDPSAVHDDGANYREQVATFVSRLTRAARPAEPRPPTTAPIPPTTGHGHT
jgi:hypothetical protein